MRTKRSNCSLSLKFSRNCFRNDIMAKSSRRCVLVCTKCSFLPQITRQTAALCFFFLSPAHFPLSGKSSILLPTLARGQINIYVNKTAAVAQKKFSVLAWRIYLKLYNSIVTYVLDFYTARHKPVLLCAARAR